MTDICDFGRAKNEGDNTTTYCASAFKGSDSSLRVHSDAKGLDQLKGPGKAIFHTTNGTEDNHITGSTTSNMSVIGAAGSADDLRGSNMTVIPESPRLGPSEFKTDNFGNRTTTKNHTGHQGAFIEGKPGETYNFETANIGSENVTYNDVDLPAESASNWSLLQNLVQYLQEFSKWSPGKKDGTIHHYHTSNKGGNNYIKNGD